MSLFCDIDSIEWHRNRFETHFAASILSIHALIINPNVLDCSNHNLFVCRKSVVQSFAKLKKESKRIIRIDEISRTHALDAHAMQLNLICIAAERDGEIGELRQQITYL